MTLNEFYVQKSVDFALTQHAPKMKAEHSNFNGLNNAKWKKHLFANVCSSRKSEAEKNAKQYSGKIGE